MFIASDRFKVPVSLLVLFATVGGITIAFTLVDILFLSTYPSNWLPYLFVGKTATLLVFTFLVGRQVAKGSRWINAAMFAFAAVTVLVSRWLLDTDIDYFPFALTLWLDVVAVLAGVISFSAVNEVFDIRQMKEIGQKVYAAGGVGGLVFGLSVPLLINVMDVNDLLYVLALVLIIPAVGLAALQPLPASMREASQSAKPTRYPLFMLTAAAFILLLVIDTFADFALKSEVAATYDREAIGSFMGPFYGLTNAITVVFQMTIVGMVMQRFGVFGLMLAVPIFGLVAAVGIWLAPGLWAAAAFRMGETILRRGFDDFGRSLVINPLPGQVRRAARLIWNGICAPIGTGLAALLLLVVSDESALRGIAVMTLLLSVGWFWVVFAMRKSYTATLDDALRSGVFTIDTEALASDPGLISELVTRSLSSGNEKDVRFGLELLAAQDVPVPREVAFFLGAESQQLRAAAVEVVDRRQDKTFTDDLTQRLEEEQVPEIRLSLFETLANTDPAASTDPAMNYLDSRLPEDRAGAALVLMGSDSPDHRQQATDTLNELMNEPSSRSRRCVARVLGLMEVGILRDVTRNLLADDSALVRGTALRSIMRRGDTTLIPDIMGQLGRPGTSFAAESALVTFGVAAIDALSETTADEDLTVRRAATRSLARIEHPDAEAALSAINLVDSVTERDAAREISHYVKRFGGGESLKIHARSRAIETAGRIRALNTASIDEKVGEVKVEIEARADLEKLSLLYWLAAATDPQRVFDVMPLLVRPNVAPGDRAMALELLESSAGDHALSEALGVFEAQSEGGESVTVDDLWISRVSEEFNKGGGVAMDLMQIVVLLRKSRLFSELPGEALYAIAEICDIREMSSGEHIYDTGDYPDGLYIVASGNVIGRLGVSILATYEPTDIFGEFELLDDSPRLADAVAETDGSLIFINKQTFEGITEDIPAVLRTLARSVVESLRASMGEAKN